MSDEGGRWRRFFRGSRCFCFGCNSCSRKSFDEENEPKMEESDEEIRLGSQLHFHRPQVHQPQKHQGKQQFLPLLPKNESGNSSSLHETTNDERVSDSAFVSPRFWQEERGVRWRGQRKVRRCSLEERIPSFVLPQSYTSCDLLDIHYLEQAQKLLNNVNKWNFNIFVLDWLTNGRSFYYLVMHLFHEYNFLGTFRLDMAHFLRTLKLVELGYCRKNPYHNSLHAADVVQAIHCNLLEDCIAPHLSPLEKMAAIMAAACHDLDHPGVNQSFLIASSHHLAPLYDGVSVLENHHWRGTVSILRESHLFDHFSHTQWNRLRYLLEILILATDISKQQDILLKFREYINSQSLDLATNEEHRNFILQITLKCADICNPCRSWKVSKKWSQLICEEFFRQGDKEKLMNLPITISFDRQQSTTAKIQTGFMSFVVEPLFIEWDKFAPSRRSKNMLNNLTVNRFKWVEIAQEDSLHGGDENQKKLSTSTLVSFLDWEDEEDESANGPTVASINGRSMCAERRKCSDLSKRFYGRKPSLSSVGSKFKSKTSNTSAEKENLNPSNGNRSIRESGVLTTTPMKGSSLSLMPPLKTGEKRRLSLPVSKQIAPSSVSQAIDQRRSSLPLARILEITNANLSIGGSTSRGGWSLMTNASSGQLESLSELSPPVDDYQQTGGGDCESLILKNTKTGCSKCLKDTESSSKKFERLKCKFSFETLCSPKVGVERSESFSSACYKKHKKYHKKIYHHYSEMVLSLCQNRWFESKRRRGSCPLAETKTLNGCSSSNRHFCSGADEDCCNYIPSSPSKQTTCKRSGFKRGMHTAMAEGDQPAEAGSVPLSELKLENIDPSSAPPGRNRRFASLTEELGWPKFWPSKKRAKSLVTSSLAEDGSVICRTHLLLDTDDVSATGCSKRNSSSNLGYSSSAAEKNIKKNIFITLQSNSKEIFTKLTSGANVMPTCNSARNNSIPQTSVSHLPGPPFNSSPAILRFVDGHVRPSKSTCKKSNSILDSGSRDGEIVPLLPKS